VLSRFQARVIVRCYGVIHPPVTDGTAWEPPLATFTTNHHERAKTEEAYGLAILRIFVHHTKFPPASSPALWLPICCRSDCRSVRNSRVLSSRYGHLIPWKLSPNFLTNVPRRCRTFAFLCGRRADTTIDHTTNIWSLFVL
jgi:hypothetical protein